MSTRDEEPIEEEEEEESTSNLGFLEKNYYDKRVSEWEMGLPSADDLISLSQPLIPLDLASAFSISPEMSRSSTDVHRASQTTFSSLRHHHSSSSAAASTDDARKSFRRSDPDESPGESPDDPTRATKRPRLVWTPQLHKRFVDVVSHLGIKNAVPKTIMQLMNVEGLTRENVASHLQKYRLYLKRMHGLSSSSNDDVGGPPDHLFASTPVPPRTFHDPNPNSPITPVMPVPILGVPPPPSSYAAFDHHHHHHNHSYHMFREQHRDWSGNNCASYIPYSQMTHTNK